MASVRLSRDISVRGAYPCWGLGRTKLWQPGRVGGCEHQRHRSVAQLYVLWSPARCTRRRRAGRGQLTERPCRR